MILEYDREKEEAMYLTNSKYDETDADGKYKNDAKTLVPNQLNMVALYQSGPGAELEK